MIDIQVVVTPDELGDIISFIRRCADRGFCCGQDMDNDVDLDLWRERQHELADRLEGLLNQ